MAVSIVLRFWQMNSTWQQSVTSIRSMKLYVMERLLYLLGHTGFTNDQYTCR